MRHAQTAVLTAIFGPMVFLLGLAVYWLFIDVDPPFISKSVETFDQYGVVTNKFRAGTTMVLRRDRCIVDTGEAIFTRRLVRTDRGEVYFMESGPQHLDLGCGATYNSVNLPPYVGKGTYDYVVTLSFVKNPLTVVEQMLPAPRIEILE
jgi:hypothetical protein